MNPFQLVSPRQPLVELEPPDEVQNCLRTMRLVDDLRALASEVERDSWASISIVKTPDRLQIATHECGEPITPLLAASLLADIEQTLTACEYVRARFAPEWRGRLLGRL